MKSSAALVTFPGAHDIQPDKCSWDHESVLKAALKERDELLKNKPELNRLQQEIDTLLSNEETFEGRIRILGEMIGSRLNKLNDECIRLETMCSRIGIETEMPITRFKRLYLNRNIRILRAEQDKLT
jgi:hypothetical protein